MDHIQEQIDNIYLVMQKKSMQKNQGNQKILNGKQHMGYKIMLPCVVTCKLKFLPYQSFHSWIP